VEKAASPSDADHPILAAAIGRGSDGSAIVLPRALDMAFASELLSRIRQRADDAMLTLDASEVDYASTPCVQILLAAGRRRDAMNCSLVIRHASDAFRRDIDDFGLQPEFSKWMV
jgi:anti-anti-sigma regulatory factor